MVYVWCKRYTETQVMLYDALWRVRDHVILNGRFRLPRRLSRAVLLTIRILLLLLELLANIDYDMPYTSKCLYNDEKQSQSAAVIKFDR